MFVMPFLLVLILTVVQDSAFRRINENIITMLIVDHDRSDASKHLVELLHESGMFIIEEDSSPAAGEVKEALIKRNKLTALYIPPDYAEKLLDKSNYITDIMLAELMHEQTPANDAELIMPALSFYHDPVLQETYSYTINNVITAYQNLVEYALMMDVLYSQMGFDEKPDDLIAAMMDKQVTINRKPASKGNINPNSTQHNVPAWTIFAMFFMVVSLGNRVVKERLSGIFLRIRTIPVNFTLIYGSKMIVYVAVALLQLSLIFSVGVLLFPLINLPQLVLPNDIPALFVVALISALAAVSYALMIGALAKTQEQANGVGAISIIIFAALGGILVPIFVMPDYMQFISKFSPLHWCLEGFYYLFLKGGDRLELARTMLPLLLFILVCQLVTYVKLKQERVF